ncbi:MAG: hypothetical protein ACTHN5_23995 [Phycisphaerae bacterium]
MTLPNPAATPTPTPEPTSITLLSLALFPLLPSRRRARNVPNPAVC